MYEVVDCLVAERAHAVALETRLAQVERERDVEREVSDAACALLAQGRFNIGKAIVKRPPWWSLHPENVRADLLVAARKAVSK